MTGRRTFVLGLAVAALSAGCGTMGNLKRPAVAPASAPDAPVCRIYGGVREDWAVMSQYQWNPVVSYLDYVVLPVLAAGGLTATFLGDTLTSPYTLAVEARRALGGSAPPDPPQTAAPEVSSSARR